MLKTVIIEDNSLEQDTLIDLCKNKPEISVVNAFSGINEAADYIQRFPVDLIISDIIVNDGNGVDFIKNLSSPPLVVFVSSHKDYAVDAFDMDVVDYIVKPLSEERFSQCVEKVLDRFINGKRVKAGDKNLTLEDFIYVKNSNDIIRLNLKDILYMESLGNFTKIHMTNDKRIVSLVGLKQLESKLPETCFMRIHRSYIVNFCHITSINSDEVKLLESTIPIGKSYKEDFMKSHVYQNLVNHK
jgi:DNA-binding LytR/AlgR family response regulator